MKPRKKTECLGDLDGCFIETEHGCWEYKYAKTEAGYGVIVFDGERVYVHRLMYRFHHPDENIDDLFICHKCDNPSCGNPDHLFAATHLDNMSDMSSKKRFPRREKHPNSKLNQTKVEEIRRKYSTGGYTLKSLSEEYEVSVALIWQVVNNKIWKGE